MAAKGGLVVWNSGSERIDVIFAKGVLSRKGTKQRSFGIGEMMSSSS